MANPNEEYDYRGLPVDDSVIGKSKSFIQNYSKKLENLWNLTIPFKMGRWLGAAGLTLLFLLRVFVGKSHYLVCYFLFIYLLYMFLLFISPLRHVVVDDNDIGADLDEETNGYTPFIRRLPEFTFWFKYMRAVIIAFIISLFPVFDIPVFWPLLLIYFILLLVRVLAAEVHRWRETREVPFDFLRPIFGLPTKPKYTI